MMPFPSLSPLLLFLPFPLREPNRAKLHIAKTLKGNILSLLQITFFFSPILLWKKGLKLVVYLQFLPSLVIIFLLSGQKGPDILLNLVNKKIT